MGKDTSAHRHGQAPSARTSAPSTSPNLAAALEYAARGWAVFPVNGKIPYRGSAGVKDATADLDLIRQWWQARPRANIAVATGKVSGFDALDVDPRDGGDKSLAELEATHGPMPTTALQHTGGDGAHYLFIHTPGLKNGSIAPGLDCKTDGGYIVVAPSVHPSGKAYSWEALAGPGEVELAPPPAWFVSAAKRQAPGKPPGPPTNGRTTRYGAQALRDECATVAAAAPGSQNETLNARSYKVGQLVGGREIAEDEAMALLVEAGQLMANGEPSRPWTAEQIRAIVERSLADGMEDPRSAPPPTRKSAARRTAPPAAPAPEAPAPPRHYHQTEGGNADRFLAEHGENLRFCVPWRRWLVWDGNRWAVDDLRSVGRKAKQTTRALYADAARMEDDTDRTNLVKWARASDKRAMRDNMMALAECEVPILPRDLDTDQWVINCANGTLDLRTGQLRAPRREDYLSKLVEVEYDQHAPCPRWLAFLQTIMGGNKETIAFLQRAVGYSLTGSTREQCFFLLYGTGKNGKSTFLQTILAMLGEYAHQTDFTTFLLRHNPEAPRNDIAALRGARFVPAIEAEAGARLAESLVKQLTGGDTVTARFLNQEFFEFLPEFKVWLAANSKPVIRGTDLAIWRRVRLVPFEVTILKAQQDPELPAKLRTELPGILAWAVNGCLEWQKHGLGEPQEVTQATEDYRTEMDVLGDYLTECCDLGPSYTATAGALYSRYAAWCDANRYHAISQQAFGTTLSERGYGRKRQTDGRIIRTGLNLKSQ